MSIIYSEKLRTPETRSGRQYLPKGTVIGGAGATISGGSAPSGNYFVLMAENTATENNYFNKNLFLKQSLFLGDYTTSSYASLNYLSSGDKLVCSATTLRISDYDITRAAADKLQFSGSIVVPWKNIYFIDTEANKDRYRIAAPSWDAGLQYHYYTGHKWYSQDLLRLQILKNGNVGIGPNTPGYKLDVNHTDPTLRVYDTVLARGILLTPSSGMINTTNTTLHFNKDNANYVTAVAGGGLMGVGTLTPSYMLHIKRDQNTATKSVVENLSTGSSAFANNALEADSGGLRLFAFSTAYNSTSNRTGRHEISSSATNGLQIVTPNLRLQNTIGTDVVNITGGNTSLNTNTYVGATIGSGGFVSGWAGSGWRINTTGAAAEFADVTVRGSLSVYELLIQQLRATNGSIVVSASAKIDSITTSTVNAEVVVFEDPSNNNVCPFAVNDIVMAQRVALDSATTVKRYVRRVSAVNGKTVTFTTATGAPANNGVVAIGDEIVRIGNTSTASRQGLVYMTADDTYAPYIDIVSGVDSWAAWTGIAKTKVRLGRLDGITDNEAGLNGAQANYYGLYSTNVHLKGHITATTGYIAGLQIGNKAMWSTDNGDQRGDGAANGIEFGKAFESERRQLISFNGSNYVMMYYESSTDWGIKGMSGSDKLFHFGSEFKILGWTFGFKEGKYTQSMSTGIESTFNGVNNNYLVGNTGGAINYLSKTFVGGAWVYSDIFKLNVTEVLCATQLRATASVKLTALPTSSSGLAAGSLFTNTLAQIQGSPTIRVVCVV